MKDVAFKVFFIIKHHSNATNRYVLCGSGEQAVLSQRRANSRFVRIYHLFSHPDALKTCLCRHYKMLIYNTGTWEHIAKNPTA